MPSLLPWYAEMETCLSLALLRVIPARMKAHALEGGTTEDGISAAQLLEAVYEHMAPGSIRERSSLLQYLRAPPPRKQWGRAYEYTSEVRLAQQRTISRPISWLRPLMLWFE